MSRYYCRTCGKYTAELEIAYVPSTGKVKLVCPKCGSKWKDKVKHLRVQSAND